MSPETKKGLFLFITLCFAIGVLSAGAAKAYGPTKKDYQDRDAIRENQKILKKTREAANQFSSAKADNEKLVKGLNSRGWNVDWSTLDLVATEKTPSKPQAAAVTGELDLDKLAVAVAKHETAYCTSPGSPTANARRNCWGIMRFYIDADGKRQRTLRTFKTTDEAKEEFKRIWSTHYKRFPDYDLAKLYSGNDKAGIWLANVTKFYNEL